MSAPKGKADPRFDRLCEAFQETASKPVLPWEIQDQRGALNLDRDGSAHRKYHALYEDLQN